LFSRGGGSTYGIPKEDTIYKPYAITYLRNDSVYFAKNGDSFSFIFKYGFVKADTFQYRYNGSTSDCTQDSISRLIVDTDGIINNYGIAIHYYNAHIIDSIFNYGACNNKFPRVLERIGITYREFIPSLKCRIDQGSPTLCYYEDDSTIHDATRIKQCKELPTRINEISNKNLFTISPNPTNGFIKISSTEEFHNGSIELFSIEGKSLFTKEIKTETTLDVSSYAKGIYLLRLITEKGTATKRLVISK